MMSDLKILGDSPPVRSEPFPPWPHVDTCALESVVETLKSGNLNYWTGSHGRLFEEEFASIVGVPHAVGVANGSVALELALHALGVERGSDVIVPSRTFVATASSVVLYGSRPVFADVDARTQNITVETIEAALTPQTSAIVVVHLAGWPCEMDRIMEFAKDRGLKVIEDCAQAQGAMFRGRPVGSWGDAAAFSFCQDKIMTTGGEGGMVTLKTERAWKLAWSFKENGKNWDAIQRGHNPSRFRWVHDDIGTNLRLTEIQSVLGRESLLRIPQWLEIRRQHASTMLERLGRIDSLSVSAPSEEVGHAYYKFYAFVRPECLSPGWTRERILQAINAEGIPCFTGSCSEIYREKAFKDMGLAPSTRLPVARQLGDTSLMFLVHPTLTAADIEDTCLAVEKVMDAAGSTMLKAAA